MVFRLFSTLIIWTLCVFQFQCTYVFSAEENFLLIDGFTDEVVLELGPHINERISPCSTFKMTLSLMGYDTGILKDENTPIWNFQDGYDNWLEVWRTRKASSFKACSSNDKDNLF